MLQTYGVLRIISTKHGDSKQPSSFPTSHTKKPRSSFKQKFNWKKGFQDLPTLWCFDLLVFISAGCTAVLVASQWTIGNGSDGKIQRQLHIFHENLLVFPPQKNIPFKIWGFPMGFSPISFKKVQIFGLLLLESEALEIGSRLLAGSSKYPQIPVFRWLPHWSGL